MTFTQLLYTLAIAFEGHLIAMHFASFDSNFALLRDHIRARELYPTKIMSNVSGNIGGERHNHHKKNTFLDSCDVEIGIVFSSSLSPHRCLRYHQSYKYYLPTYLSPQSFHFLPRNNHQYYIKRIIISGMS